MLCDDHLVFADALASLLVMRGHDIVARAGDVAGAAKQAAADRPDVVVTDLSFPDDVPGLSTVGVLRGEVPDIPIVALTGLADVKVLRAALDAGADGVVLKNEGVEELERVLAAVTAPLFVKMRRSLRPEKAWSRRTRALAQGQWRHRVDDFVTAREREVLLQLARGGSTSAIAATLGIGEATLRTHLQNLYNKLGVHSRLELVALAVRSGMVQPEGSSIDRRENGHFGGGQDAGRARH